MRNLLFLAALLLAFHSSAQTTYTIAGTVVSSDSNRPLKNVLVAITSTGKPPRQSSCMTGEDGRFVFSNLPAGKFSLSAQTPSSRPQLFHQSEDYSTAVVTGPGLDSQNIRFAFTPAGSISGIIQDEAGDPVREAQVVLFHQGIFSGRLRTRLERQEASNSSGSFHFGQLKPGAYLLAVIAHPWYAQNGMGQMQPSAAELDVAYPVTYYGGSTDPASASLITVTEGATTKVDFSLRAVPAVHVEIANTGSENENLGVQVLAIGPGGATMPTNGVFLNVGNRLELTGVAPGRYMVAKSSGGRKIVDLAASSSLDLRDFPEAHISGRVTFEGEPSPPAGAIVVFSSPTAHMQPSVSPDGSFLVSGAQPGHYRLQLVNAPAYYIQSVNVGGQASPDGDVDVPAAGDLQVSILAAKGVTAIDGIATKDGVPFAGAMVLLLPDDLSRTVLIRRDQSDSDGTFTLPDVAPGSYTLVAIDDGRDLAYMEPPAIKPYLSAGHTISVPLTGSAPVKVNVLSRQR